MLTNIDFTRIKGGKPFDLTQPWFTGLLESVGQPPATPVHG